MASVSKGAVYRLGEEAVPVLEHGVWIAPGAVVVGNVLCKVGKRKQIRMCARTQIRCVRQAAHLLSTPHPILYIYVPTLVDMQIRRKADSSVWFNAVVRGDNELITIGARSNIQDNAVLHSDDGSPLTIGDGVSVTSTSHSNYF